MISVVMVTTVFKIVFICYGDSLPRTAQSGASLGVVKTLIVSPRLKLKKGFSLLAFLSVPL